jgi:hypothetical protein
VSGLLLGGQVAQSDVIVEMQAYFGVVTESALSFRLQNDTADLLMEVHLNYSGNLSRYDTFWIYLPSFTGSTIDLGASHDLSASWDQCTNVLQIVSQAQQLSSYIRVIVSGLAASSNGITPLITTKITVSSNASDGIVEPTPILNVEIMGRFVASSIDVSPKTLLKAVDLSLTLQPSIDSPAGSNITISLPGFTADESSLMCSGALISFKATWSSANEELLISVREFTFHSE